MTRDNFKNLQRVTETDFQALIGCQFVRRTEKKTSVVKFFVEKTHEQTIAFGSDRIGEDSEEGNFISA